MRDVRRVAAVSRWAIVPTIRRQSVAEHMYFVGLYTSEACQRLGLGPEETTQALAYALEHDLAEAYTGDMASPIKKHLGGALDAFEERVIQHLLGRPRRAVSKLTHDIVAFADRLEAAVWLAEEVAMGNARVTHLRDRLVAKALEAAQDVGLTSMLWECIAEVPQQVGWWVTNDD